MEMSPSPVLVSLFPSQPSLHWLPALIHAPVDILAIRFNPVPAPLERENNIGQGFLAP